MEYTLLRSAFGGATEGFIFLSEFVATRSVVHSFWRKIKKERRTAQKGQERT